MTALIADTSPILRNIPSDPADRRSFEFSPSPMPARYLPEDSQDSRHSPSPHSYAAREVPTIYPHRYGYTTSDAYAHADPGVPAPVTCKSCRCQHQCSCNSAASKTAQHQQPGSSERPPAMWRKDDDDHLSSSNMTTNSRPDHFHVEASARPIEAASTAVSVPAPSRSPSPSAPVLALHHPREHNVMPTIELTSSPPRKSDWENLLGAVDLELRAQQRSKFVPDPVPTTPMPSHHFAHAINAAHHHHQHQPLDQVPLHPGTTVDNNSNKSNGYAHQQQSAASVSPEFGPMRSAAAASRHHRRGGGIGDDISGGGPAYSGSTADAACLLATLPQRMLDRASTASSHHHHHHHHHQVPHAAVAAAAAASATAMGNPPGVVMMPPTLVSASGPPVTPVRVQASGRRGPRGQSRFKGVCITRAGKWRAVIYIGRKQKYLGVFDSEFDAARAYDAAALQHFAEGAKLNFPDGIERQLNEISSVSGRAFSTAGAGGAAAPRSCTPPAFLETAAAAAVAAGSSSSPLSAKRNRKAAFGDHDDDDGWVREDGPWHPSRR